MQHPASPLLSYISQMVSHEMQCRVTNDSRKPHQGVSVLMACPFSLIMVRFSLKVSFLPGPHFRVQGASSVNSWKNQSWICGSKTPPSSSQPQAPAPC